MAQRATATDASRLEAVQSVEPAEVAVGDGAVADQPPVMAEDQDEDVEEPAPAAEDDAGEEVVTIATLLHQLGAHPTDREVFLQLVQHVLDQFPPDAHADELTHWLEAISERVAVFHKLTRPPSRRRRPSNDQDPDYEPGQEASGEGVSGSEHTGPAAQPDILHRPSRVPTGPSPTLIEARPPGGDQTLDTRIKEGRVVTAAQIRDIINRLAGDGDLIDPSRETSALAVLQIVGDTCVTIHTTQETASRLLRLMSIFVSRRVVKGLKALITSIRSMQQMSEHFHNIPRATQECNYGTSVSQVADTVAAYAQLNEFLTRSSSHDIREVFYFTNLSDHFAALRDRLIRYATERAAVLHEVTAQWPSAISSDLRPDRLARAILCINTTDVRDVEGLRRRDVELLNDIVIGDVARLFGDHLGMGSLALLAVGKYKGLIPNTPFDYIQRILAAVNEHAPALRRAYQQVGVALVPRIEQGQALDRWLQVESMQEAQLDQATTTLTQALQVDATRDPDNFARQTQYVEEAYAAEDDDFGLLNYFYDPATNTLTTFREDTIMGGVEEAEDSGAPDIPLEDDEPQPPNDEVMDLTA